MKLKQITVVLIAVLLTSAAALAQNSFSIPAAVQKRLEARASSHNKVNLEHTTLQLASQFMNNKNDTTARDMVQKLHAVDVESYKFDKPGEYTSADLAAIRRQFETSPWTPIVEQHSKNGPTDSDIYVKSEGGEIVGMFILSAQPKELDLVYLSGPINLSELSSMGGNFGIPTLKHRGNGTAKGAGK